MVAATGPARYFFLRRVRGAHEEASHWPPEIKPLQLPDNQVMVAVLLYPEEYGWRAETVKDEAALKGDLGGAFVMTRDTTISATPDDRRVIADLALMGVRVALAGDKGSEYATHLVVRVLDGGGGMPRRPIVVPIDWMVLGEYIEHGKRTVASAQLHVQASDALAAKGLGDISVLSEHGLIILSGVVKDNATRHQARDIALKIPGVKGVVVTDLAIQPSPAAEPVVEPETAEVHTEMRG